MDKSTTVGLDLAKQVTAVHAVAADGRTVMRKTLRRDQLLPWLSKLPPCVVAMEACGGAHHWARELSAEPMGRAAVIHFETEIEQGIARFEMQRASRPDTGWRTIAQVPATGGGDYHVIDSHFPGHAYYRLVPVLKNGLRAAPSMLLSVGETPGK